MLPTRTMNNSLHQAGQLIPLALSVLGGLFRNVCPQSEACRAATGVCEAVIEACADADINRSASQQWVSPAIPRSRTLGCRTAKVECMSIVRTCFNSAICTTEQAQRDAETYTLCMEFSELVGTIKSALVNEPDVVEPYNGVSNGYNMTVGNILLPGIVIGAVCCLRDWYLARQRQNRKEKGKTVRFIDKVDFSPSPVPEPGDPVFKNGTARLIISLGEFTKITEERIIGILSWYGTVEDCQIAYDDVESIAYVQMASDEAANSVVNCTPDWWHYLTEGVDIMESENIHYKEEEMAVEKRL